MLPGFAGLIIAPHMCLAPQHLVIVVLDVEYWRGPHCLNGRARLVSAAARSSTNH